MSVLSGIEREKVNDILKLSSDSIVVVVGRLVGRRYSFHSSLSWHF